MGCWLFAAIGSLRSTRYSLLKSRHCGSADCLLEVDDGAVCGDLDVALEHGFDRLGVVLGGIVGGDVDAIAFLEEAI